MIFPRIKNIFLVIICYLKFFSKGKADKKTDQPEKILVVQLAKIGDMVCTTPMFKAVKEKYPNCIVYVIGNKINKELLANNRDVDRYFIFDGRIISMMKTLNKEKIDFACLTTPSFLSLVLLYLSNIKSIAVPKIIGDYCPQYTNSFKLISRFVINVPHYFYRYAPREYLRLLEPAGIKTDKTKKNLSFTEEAEQKVIDFYQKHNIVINQDVIIGIAPSVGNKIKLWGVEKYLELISYIKNNYQVKIVIFGGQSDCDEIEKILVGVDDKKDIINSCCYFNIDELKAAISKLFLFISVDTGPIYIAESFNIATIDIVGPMDENNQPPLGNMHRVVKAERKKAEIYVMNARHYNEKEARRQVDEISVDMVKREVDNLLSIYKKFWGEERWIVNRDYCGKILVLKKGHRCSYHCHKDKDETFYINKGKVLLEIGSDNLKKAKKEIMEQGQSILVKPHQYHRFTGLVNSEIIEFSTTHNDKDSYRKTKSSQALPASIFSKIIENFKESKVLVVGDIILDQYVLSDPQKISPEAPILVSQAKNSKNVLGGAANVCNNLRDLGVGTEVIGLVGNDEDSKIILKLLKDKKINGQGVFKDRRVTTKKVRIIAGNQQLLRIDYEDRHDANKQLENRIFKYFIKIADQFGAVILSDYGKGVLTKSLTKKLINYCKDNKIKILVDPIPAHTENYTGATVITPNLTEAMAMSGISDKKLSKDIGKRLLRKLNSNIVLTLGGEGMLVVEKNKISKIKTSVKEVFDVSGAGDTVIAVIAACLASGSKLLPACKLANIAAGIEVAKFGTATVSLEEIKDFLYYEK